MTYLSWRLQGVQISLWLLFSYMSPKLGKSCLQLTEGNFGEFLAKFKVIIFEPYEECSWNFQDNILLVRASFGLSFNKIWGVIHGHFRSSWWFDMKWNLIWYEIVGVLQLLPDPVAFFLNCFVFIHSHEDGTVKFWNVSSLSYTLLYTISTSHLFENDFDGGPPPDDEEEDWPPFKKVGAFDPYADDPRFVIQKLLFCPVTKTLIVGGSGGQVIWYTLQDNDSTAVEVSS